MFYITGDTHRDFDHIINFCQEYSTTKDDILIILGDAGINYFGDSRDIKLKEKLCTLPITLFCIHGNHEMRPQTIETYKLKERFLGYVFVEDKYPNILFAKDGEIYNFNGYKSMAIGGAYSIDKYYRLSNGYHWFEDEQPGYAIKRFVESKLRELGWRIDYIFSHTCPISEMPKEAFIEGIDQSRVDKTTENWLELIKDKTEFKKWYYGHFHTEKQHGKFEILYKTIKELEEVD